MRVVLLVCFLALASASFLPTPSFKFDHKEHAETVVAHVETHARALSEFSNVASAIEGHLKVQDLVSCTAAGSTALTQLISCVTKITTASTKGDDASVKDFCTSTCMADIDKALTSIATACTGVDITSIPGVSSMLPSLGNAMNVMCVKDDAGKYCMPVFMQMKDSVMTQMKSQSPDLSGICSPCMTAYMRGVSNMGGNDNAITMGALNTLCIKDADGKLCYPQFTNMGQAMQGGMRAGIICDNSCYRIMMRSIKMETKAGSPDIAGMLDMGFCDRDVDGAYCFDKVMAMPDTSICPDFKLSDASCSDSCKTSVNAALGKLGCCGASVLKLLPKIMPEMSALPKCQITPAAGCTTAAVKVTVPLMGVKCAWLNDAANKIKAQTGLIADMANQFALPPSMVKAAITCSTADDKASVEVTLTPDSNQAAAGLQRLVDSKGNALSIPNTAAAIPAEAKINPVAALTVGATTTSVSGVPTTIITADPAAKSSASSVGFSTLTILFALVCAFFNIKA